LKTPPAAVDCVSPAGTLPLGAKRRPPRWTAFRLRERCHSARSAGRRGGLRFARGDAATRRVNVQVDELRAEQRPERALQVRDPDLKATVLAEPTTARPLSWNFSGAKTGEPSGLVAIG